jgi:hypothetical protein
MATGIGMHVMRDMFAGNSEDTDFIRKREMIQRDIALENSEENVEIRKGQIKKWVGIAAEVIDEDLIESYKHTLTDFVAYGPTTGSLMDLAMSVLTELKTADTMDYAVEMFNSIEKDSERFYVQNMAFMYSDKGPDFVTKTIGRPLTISEIACFDLKRSENINRKKGN